MNEDELKAGILDAATATGWLIHHDRPARTANGWTTAIEGHVGFPDLILVHRHKPAVLVAELKGNHGRVSPAQRVWLDRFAAAGVTTRLWTPANYDEALDELAHWLLPDRLRRQSGPDG